MKKKIVIIVQARMGSERLPGKTLKLIQGKPMLEHLIDRLKLCRNIDSIIVATSTREEDMVIVDLTGRCGVDHFLGSETDVLDRYVKAAEEANASVVVRVTGDNPLTDPYILDRLVKHHIETNADYTTMKNLPLGITSEVFSIESLKRSDKLGIKPHHREHVDEYILENPDKFRMEVLDADESIRRPDLRLTVDTEEDLELMRRIFRRLEPEGDEKVIKLSSVIKLLDSDPDLVKINAYVVQKEADRE